MLKTILFQIVSALVGDLSTISDLETLVSVADTCRVDPLHRQRVSPACHVAMSFHSSTCNTVGMASLVIQFQRSDDSEGAVTAVREAFSEFSERCPDSSMRDFLLRVSHHRDFVRSEIFNSASRCFEDRVGHRSNWQDRCGSPRYVSRLPLPEDVPALLLRREVALAVYANQVRTVEWIRIWAQSWAIRFDRLHASDRLSVRLREYNLFHLEVRTHASAKPALSTWKQ
jgi:hypothetical protein